MLQNAANFKQHDFLAQLLFESTVTGRKIEMQTYIKVIITLYYDMAHLSRNAHTDLMDYLLKLFKQDCTTESDYNLGNDLIQEFILASSEEPYANLQNQEAENVGKKKNKHRKNKNKKKNEKEEVPLFWEQQLGNKAPDFYAVDVSDNCFE